MTYITNSTYTEGAVQADGKTSIVEQHESSDGVARQYIYDADLSLVDPQSVMSQRAAKLEAEYEALQASGTIIQITKATLIRRLTRTEVKKILAQENTDLDLKFFLFYLEHSGGVRFDDPLFAEGLQYLVYINVLTPDRPAQILAA